MPTIEYQALHRYQYQLYDDMQRWNCWVCHRRFGKTVLCLQILIIKALANELLAPRYAYLAPLYKQARAAAWDYLRLLAGYIPGVRFWENELRCRLPNGAEIRLIGADNPDALRGIYLDGVVLDEYAQMRPRVWSEVVRPTLSDQTRRRPGNQWAIFIGTPYGENHFYELYRHALQTPGWHVQVFRASETQVIPPDELDDARRMMSEDEYDQEYECSWFATVPGAYYAEELRQIDTDGRITTVPYDPALPTSTAWDLGHNDTNAIWVFQSAGREVRFIDYLEGSGVALAYDRPQQQGWIDRVRALPYIYDHSQLLQPLTLQPYETHYGPHDLNNTEYSSGKTRYTYALERGFRFTVLPHPGPGGMDDGILAARRLLARAVFDEERCSEGLRALRNYRRHWDPERRVFANHPLHDWASNGADAFRYAAVGLMPPPSAPRAKPPPGSFARMQRLAQRYHQGRPIRGVAYKAYPHG